MEIVLVDTDVFSYLWQDRPEAVAYRKHVAGRIVALSFTSVAEAYYGAHKRKWGPRRLAQLEAAMRPYLLLP
jgi:tRNA(fMet)-specific endonuclease VapC